MKEIKLPRPEFPRPDFIRDQWVNLNGEWEFDFDDNNEGEKGKWYNHRAFSKKIIVPFCFQSKLSGIEDKSLHDIVWYQRSFTLSEQFKGKSVILYFGAVDYYTKVWVNGVCVGEHKGGYSSFKFDITNQLRDDENLIAIRVEDTSTNASQPRGKQSWMKKNFGCWYTQVTGIWQTVWLEAVTGTYIDKFKITPDIQSGSIILDIYIKGIIEDRTLDTTVYFKDKKIAVSSINVFRKHIQYTIDVKSDEFEWKLMLWAPGTPNLYDIEFVVKKDDKLEDCVKSYFGMRSISIRNGEVLLNNRPIYQKLVLDQGYFDGGLLTAASDEDYIHDIKITKQLGFNGVRKHQKVEDPRYLYWADRLGLLVWGEMGSPYEFDDDMITENTNEWRSVIERDYNHPSIITWTLMNESWGIPSVMVDKKQQNHTVSLYYMVKSYDDTRIVISNDGWDHTVSDILTFHNYEQNGDKLRESIIGKEKILKEPISSIGNIPCAKYLFAEGYEYSNQPIIISECAGIAYNGGDGWGYGEKVNTEDEFLQRYKSIIKAIYDTSYIKGFCCTQLTDVEQEINGILSVDRKPKADVKEFAKIINNAKFNLVMMD